MLSGAHLLSPDLLIHRPLLATVLWTGITNMWRQQNYSDSPQSLIKKKNVWGDKVKYSQPLYPQVSYQKIQPTTDQKYVGLTKGLEHFQIGYPQGSWNPRKLRHDGILNWWCGTLLISCWTWTHLMGPKCLGRTRAVSRVISSKPLYSL